MKALLPQLTGGGPSRGDMMSAAGPESQKMKADSAGAGDSSFIGLMRGFLGMNKQPAGASGEAAGSPEGNKEGQKSAAGSSVPGPSGELPGKNNTGDAARMGGNTGEAASLEGDNGEAALLGGNKTGKEASGSVTGNEAPATNNGKAPVRKSAEGEAKNKINSMPAAEKLSTRPAREALQNVKASGTASSKAGSSGEEGGMVKNTDGTSGKETSNVPGKAKKGNAGGNINQPEGATAKDTQQLKTKPKGETPEEGKIKSKKSTKGAPLGDSVKGAVKSTNARPAAGGTRGDRVAAPVIDETSVDGKEQAASNKRAASQIQVEKVMRPSAGQKSEIVNEGKKNPGVAADVMKKEQQKEAKKSNIKGEKGRARETAARRSAAQASPSAPAFGQNGNSALRKADVNIKNLAPGKMVSSETSGTIEAETDPANPKDAGPSPEKSFKEIHLNEFKSTRLNEAAGRKKFSSHLSRLGRQQASGQTRETERQSTQWKHHRIVMKDGKALNIAARSADGALQLQLNAGSGELGRVLQQHLQEIKQHVQQELNIKVDLQLQDFSGGQSEQQQEAGSSQTQRKMRNISSSGESGGSAASKTSSGTERVRYLGFNNNEWTA